MVHGLEIIKRMNDEAARRDLVTVTFEIDVSTPLGKYIYALYISRICSETIEPQPENGVPQGERWPFASPPPGANHPRPVASDAGYPETPQTETVRDAGFED